MATITQEQFSQQLAYFVELTKSTESPWTLQTRRDVLYGMRKEMKMILDNGLSDASSIDMADGDEHNNGDGFGIDEEEEGVQHDANRHSLSLPCSLRMIQFEYNILYSESYSVPVLYFQAINADGKQISLEDVWKLIPNVYHQHESIDFQNETSEERFARLSSMISQNEHPIVGTPFYWIHPCQTSLMMEKVSPLMEKNDDGPFDDPSIRSNYLITWLSTIGPVVGIRLNLIRR
ncbi:autophagy-related 10 [Brevipalpus obovatus]|uniref:autophagy-related 10 n=1 Tax=Brevipalpus obovatus TaxID=246614 RepID=UPI003D9E2569